MSLVYLVTSLPRLSERALSDGRPLPISRTDFIKRARQALEGPHKEQFELLMLLEEIDDSCRIISESQAQDPTVSAGELAARLRTRRRPTPDAPGLDALPDWVLMPLARHVQLRRLYQLYYEKGGAFLKGWAQFATDLEEVLTGLIARHEGLSSEAFAQQMEGRFDSSSEVILRRVAQPDLGLGKRFPWMPRVVAALEGDDRMAGERALDQLRLDTIDQLMGTELFSIETVLGTYLKLRIYERHASWQADAGRKRLDDMLALPDSGLSADDTGPIPDSSDSLDSSDAGASGASA